MTCPRCGEHGQVELDRDYFRYVFLCAVCGLRMLARDLGRNKYDL